MSADTIAILIALGVATGAIIKFLMGLTKEIANIKIEIADLKVEMIKMDSKFERKIDKLDAKFERKIDKLDAKFDLIDERYKSTAARVDKIETEIATVKEDVKEMKIIKEDVKVANEGVLNIVEKLTDKLQTAN